MVHVSLVKQDVVHEVMQIVAFAECGVAEMLRSPQSISLEFMWCYVSPEIA